jgi:hypothetical protein
MDVFLLFSVGFLSLFMLARNERVGQKPSCTFEDRKTSKITPKTHPSMTNPVEVTSNPYKKHASDPLSLLKNIVEQIIIMHDEHMDLETRVRLEAMQVGPQKNVQSV